MQDVLTQESLSTAEYKDIVFIAVATSLYQIVMIMCDVTKEPTTYVWNWSIKQYS